MTTAKDLKITESKLREYSNGNPSKLTYPQLQFVTGDYLNRVMRTQDKWRNWPKDVQKQMKAMGVLQSKSTGYPIMTNRKKKSWSEQFTAEASEVVELSDENDSLREKIKDLEKAVEDLKPEDKPKPIDIIPKKPKPKTKKVVSKKPTKTNS